MLAEWLDFAHETNKDFAWVDELRCKIDEPWYSKSWIPFQGGSGLNKGTGVGIKQEQELVIPMLQKLVARNHLFNGYIGQYEFLISQKMLPSEFEEKLAKMPETSSVDGYFILEPSKWFKDTETKNYRKIK